jgi:hypothetical protein
VFCILRKKKRIVGGSEGREGKGRNAMRRELEGWEREEEKR